MARALDAVTPERGAGHCITSPIVGGRDQPLSGGRVGDRPRHPAQQAGEAGAGTIEARDQRSGIGARDSGLGSGQRLTCAISDDPCAPDRLNDSVAPLHAGLYRGYIVKSSAMNHISLLSGFQCLHSFVRADFECSCGPPSNLNAFPFFGSRLKNSSRSALSLHSTRPKSLVLSESPWVTGIRAIREAAKNYI